jgi:isopenicillin-N N-acyltransferase-like protein
MTVVRVSGSHREMGRQYGRQCGSLIRGLVAEFDGVVLRPENVAAGRAVAKAAMPCVEAVAPELVEEVIGIAEGAGVAVDDVFRLNCSSELFAWQGCRDQEPVNTVPKSQECTSFAARGREGTLVAWNMDWWRAWQPYLLLLHGEPDDGPEFLAVAMAGSLGRPGLNPSLAVAANYLPYRQRASQPGQQPRWLGPGVPYNVMARILLQQTCVADAVAALARTRRMVGLNYTLGDRHGNLACVETTPDEHDVLLPPEDFIVHANSFHSPGFKGLTEASQERSDPRAFDARRQLRACPHPLDRGAIQAVQVSHFAGQRTGVCVHQDMGGREGITLLSFVAEVSARQLWLAWGPPCEHAFLAYGL